MANETVTTIVGNLTADPELSSTDKGVSWVRFTVASTPRRFDRDSGQYVDGNALFMRCTAWRDLAEHINESLTKGTRVVVTGRLRQNTWETPEGDRRSSIDLDVDEIGPSLRFATAKVAKLSRSSAPGSDPNDPFVNPTAAASASGNTRADDAPPF